MHYFNLSLSRPTVRVGREFSERAGEGWPKDRIVFSAAPVGAGGMLIEGGIRQETWIGDHSPLRSNSTVEGSVTIHRGDWSSRGALGRCHFMEPQHKDSLEVSLMAFDAFFDDCSFENLITMISSGRYPDTISLMVEQPMFSAETGEGQEWKFGGAPITWDDQETGPRTKKLLAAELSWETTEVMEISKNRLLFLSDPRWVSVVLLLLILVSVGFT